MMKYYTELKDAHSKPYRRGKGCFSDTVYCFDLEDTNLFKINGKWQQFDKSIKQKEYRDIEKMALPYIWQFGINDDVYYGEELSQFEEVLRKISNPKITKIVFVFNLSHEFAFFQDFLVNYTVSDMIAREPRKPISFYIAELNINFRCLYMLTGLSLANASKRFTNLEKAVGDLDYDVIRTPASVPYMTQKELGYCERDISTMIAIVRYFRKEYGHIRSIPYTQTGEVRRAYLKTCPNEWIWHCQDTTPRLWEYKVLKLATWGGYTHANALWTNQTLFNVHSYDKTSDYPYQLCAEKYPCENFQRIDTDNALLFPNSDYAKIYHVRFYGVSGKIFNHYIPYSKCLYTQGEVLDNGKIVLADMIEIVCTDCDMMCIGKAYNVERTEIVALYVAEKDYLPKHMIEFILDLYANKTTLKGSEDGTYEANLYMKSKQLINSVFGMCLTDTIKTSILWDKGEWVSAEATDDFIEEKLNEQRRSKRNTLLYSNGVWCTAFGRAEIFDAIVKTDRDECYSDTDSVKLQNAEKYKEVFEEYNRICDEKLRAMCEARGIDFERTRPCDNKGIPHPLGYFELETDGCIYQEFKTLGAKKYCYRQKGKLHLVVAGLGKGNERDGYSIDYLQDDINNFNTSAFWGYDDAHKLTHIYIDDQTPQTIIDAYGNKYTSHQQHGVVLFPTTYDMGITFDYECLLEDMESMEYQNPNFSELNERLRERKREKVSARKHFERRKEQ